MTSRGQGSQARPSPAAADWPCGQALRVQACCDFQESGSRLSPSSIPAFWAAGPAPHTRSLARAPPGASASLTPCWHAQAWYVPAAFIIPPAAAPSLQPPFQSCAPLRPSGWEDTPTHAPRPRAAFLPLRPCMGLSLARAGQLFLTFLTCVLLASQGAGPPSTQGPTPGRCSVTICWMSKCPCAVPTLLRWRF